jgi:hypothetical protein
MSRARKIDVIVETVSTSRLVGYGVESTRLNFDMNTDVLSYEAPYEDFQCYAANGVDDLRNKDHQVEEFDHGRNDVDDVVPCTDPYHELPAPRADSDTKTSFASETVAKGNSLQDDRQDPLMGRKIIPLRSPLWHAPSNVVACSAHRSWIPSEVEYT